MSLNAKQARFTLKIAELIIWANKQGIQVIGSELYRTREQAALYAAQNKGILSSVHTKRLALDLYIFKGGTITWDTDDYRPLGEKWRKMDTEARWGGDFKNRDCVHFSFEHNGVK